LGITPFSFGKKEAPSLLVLEKIGGVIGFLTLLELQNTEQHAIVL
jgi:hypothetical protein